MDMFTAPLKLSTAGIRLMGYMVETNMKMAQASSRAMIEAQIGFMGLRREPAAPTAKAAPKKAAAPAKKPAAKAKAPAQPKTEAKPTAEAQPRVKTAAKPKTQPKAPVAAKPAPKPKAKPA